MNHCYAPLFVLVMSHVSKATKSSLQPVRAPFSVGSKFILKVLFGLFSTNRSTSKSELVNRIVRVKLHVSKRESRRIFAHSHPNSTPVIHGLEDDRESPAVSLTKQTLEWSALTTNICPCFGCRKNRRGIILSGDACLAS